MNIIDKNLYRLADKYWKHLALLVLLLFSFLIRRSMFKVQGEALDWGVYLAPWIQEYRTLGFKGLGHIIGDYYIPYNIILAVIAHLPFPDYYSVAFVSYLFELGMSFELYLLAKKYFNCSSFNAALIAVLVLFLPITFLDSSYWKQCDAIYTFFTLAGIRNLLSDRPNKGLIMIGFALSFKLQAVFILPFCCYLYFKKRNIPLLSFLWIPGIFLLSGLPAILFGRSVTSTYGAYLTQVHSSRFMSINSANIWSFVPEGLDLYGAAIILCFSLLLACYVFLYQRRQDEKNFLLLASWTVITCFMFLPSMHERYDYVGLILLYLCAFGGHFLWLSALLLHIISMLTYLQYLLGLTYSIPVMSCFYFTGYIILTYRLLTQNCSNNSIQSNESFRTI